MALNIQNFRSEVTGESPDSLKPGQIAFNLADSILFIGDGSDSRKGVNGSVILPNPPSSEGWQAFQLIPDGGVVDSVTGSGAISVSPTTGDVVVSVASGNTSQAGVVQLTNSTTITSSTEALSATGAKILQDQINALSVSSNLILAGTFDANTGLMVSVTALGSGEGFTAGAPIPSAAAGNTDYFVIVEVAGNNGPAGTPPYEIGDWFLSDGTSWNLLNIGSPAAASATPTTVGGVYGLTNTTDNSTALGYNALSSVISGSGNVGIGFNAGRSVTVGNSNVAVGGEALQAVTSGTLNTALGEHSGFALTTGSFNVFLGHYTGCTLTTGCRNLFFGGGSGQTLASGSDNVFIGDSSGQITSGCSNVAIGPNVQLASATGSCQLAIGFGSGSNWMTGDSTGAIRPGAGILDASGDCGSVGQFLSTSGANDLVWSNLPSITGTAPITTTTDAFGNTVIDIDPASTTVPGAVQLNNTLTSTSTTEALTAAQGKNLQDTVSALALSSNLTLAGTFDATAGQLLSVTAAGTSQGFIVGSNLPAAAAGNLDYFVIVSTGGSYNPPGGGGPYTITQGDWLLSNGTVWQFLNVGTDMAAATPTVAGSVLGRQFSSNNAYGCNALVASSGTGNTALGHLAGCALTTGNSNTVIGVCAGDALTTSSNVVAVGPNAAGALSTANNLTAIGSNALANNVVGFNTAVGAGALFASTNGAGNAAFGNSAGGSVTTGQNNTLLGHQSGIQLTTGNQNVLVGVQAGCSYTTASNNIVVGNQPATNTDNGFIRIGIDGQTAQIVVTNTGSFCVSGSGFGTSGQFLMSQGSGQGPIWSTALATPIAPGMVLGCTVISTTALGCNALLAQTTGSGNTSVGHNAGCAITSGFNNTVIGSCAGDSLTTSCFGVFVGASAGCSVTTAIGNVAIGTAAGCLTTGDRSVFVGLNAGDAATTGSRNVVIGPYAQVPVATGSCQLAIGFDYTANWLTGDSTKAIKPGAGIVDCANSCGTAGQVLMSNGANAICWNSALATPFAPGMVIGCTTTNACNNVLLGCKAGCLITTGANHTYIGAQAGAAQVSNFSNIAIGLNALNKHTGGNTTAIGVNALANLTTGVENVALGEGAGANIVTACENTFLGFLAGFLTTGGCNTVVGNRSGSNMTVAQCSTLVGARAGFAITTGLENTLVGYQAGSSITTGCYNVAIGARSLGPLTTGITNTALGNFSAQALTTGCANIFVGDAAGNNLTTGSRNIIIGANSLASSATVSNEVTIATAQSFARFSGFATAWFFPSDVRLKENVEDLALGLDFVNQLQPRTFDWKETGHHAAGFVAQEVEEVVQEHDAEYLGIVNKSDPEKYSLAAASLIPVLVNAIKELQANFEEATNRVGALEQEVAKLKGNE